MDSSTGIYHTHHVQGSSGLYPMSGGSSGIGGGNNGNHANNGSPIQCAVAVGPTSNVPLGPTPSSHQHVDAVAPYAAQVGFPHTPSVPSQQVPASSNGGTASSPSSFGGSAAASAFGGISLDAVAIDQNGQPIYPNTQFHQGASGSDAACMTPISGIPPNYSPFSAPSSSACV
ncbi:hypothetical protein LPJ75_003865, partial [Coemansia sp. RSA 2598]